MKFTFETSVRAFKNYDKINAMLFKYNGFDWQITFHGIGLKCSVTMPDWEFEKFLQMIYDRRRELRRKVH